MTALRALVVAALATLLTMIGVGAAQAYPDAGVSVSGGTVVGGQDFGYTASSTGLPCTWTVKFNGQVQTPSGASVSGSFTTNEVPSERTSTIVATCSYTTADGKKATATATASVTLLPVDGTPNPDPEPTDGNGGDNGGGDDGGGDDGGDVGVSVNGGSVVGGQDFAYTATSTGQACSWTISFNAQSQSRSGASVSGSFTTNEVPSERTSLIVATCAYTDANGDPATVTATNTVAILPVGDEGGGNNGGGDNGGGDDVEVAVNGATLVGGQPFAYTATSNGEPCTWTISYGGESQSKSGASVTGSFDTPAVGQETSGTITATCRYETDNGGQATATATGTVTLLPADDGGQNGGDVGVSVNGGSVVGGEDFAYTATSTGQICDWTINFNGQSQSRSGASVSGSFATNAVDVEASRTIVAIFSYTQANGDPATATATGTVTILPAGGNGGEDDGADAVVSINGATLVGGQDFVYTATSNDKPCYWTITYGNQSQTPAGSTVSGTFATAEVDQRTSGTVTAICRYETDRGGQATATATGTVTLLPVGSDPDPTPAPTAQPTDGGSTNGGGSGSDGAGGTNGGNGSDAAPAAGSSTGDSVDSGALGFLPGTGGASLWILAGGAALVLIGGGTFVAARRRA